MIVEYVHGSKVISKTKASEFAPVPRMGEHVSMVFPQKSGLYRVEYVTWMTIQNGGTVKATVFVSEVDPALMPNYKAPSEN